MTTTLEVDSELMPDENFPGRPLSELIQMIMNTNLGWRCISVVDLVITER